MDKELWKRRVKRLTLFARYPLSTLRGNAPRYIYHHIPKTGGMAVAEALDKWFVVYRDYYLKKGLPGDDQEYRESPADILSFSGLECLSGHFSVEGTYLHQRYPEALSNPRFKLFTFVRDPLQTRISLYYFEKKRGLNDRYSLEQELLGRNNFIARRFPCHQDNYEEMLERYFFIGITERSQASMDLLAELIGRPRVTLGNPNATSRDHEETDLSMEVIEEFKKSSFIDYLIYDFCVNRFESMLKAHRVAPGE